jgi:RNA polymerase sigma-70 factor, ECF subfamily
MDAETMPLPPEGEPASSSLPGVAGVATREARIEAMVATHFDLIWRSLRRLGVADASLDDAAQHVFIVAARRWDVIEEGGEKPYLMGIAVRVASETRRSRIRRREVSDEEAGERIDPEPSPEELVDRKRARQVLDRLLEAMPMDLRAPFTMFEIEGMSVPEVAEALALPLGTASSRLRRAREHFHDQVRRLGLHRQGGQGV